MRNRQTPAQLTVASTAVLLVLCSSRMLGQDAAAPLVKQLPTSQAVRQDVELEKRIADLGKLALPALANELHLGIRFKRLNQILQSGDSRRWASVRVLARIPGDESTSLLVQSLSDPPDCYGMTVTILAALASRTLSNDQIVAMLGNHDPEIRRRYGRKCGSKATRQGPPAAAAAHQRKPS